MNKRYAPAIVLLCACSAAYAGSFEQLRLAAPSADVPQVPVTAPEALQAQAGQCSRFPTGAHEYFNTALIFNVGENDKGGDYYPFAGKPDGRTDECGNPVGTLLAGMGSEGGHPNLFANGGDPERIWKEALKSYRELDFPSAYYSIGQICHLTQDQAVPVHAANINHVITLGDRFEKSIKKNLSLFEKIKGQITALALPDLPPYGYYQALQDDTRAHLAEWTNPATGKPYWPAASGAPAPGSDATRGPWSHYSDDKDSYDVNARPDIMSRQVLMAAAYTAGVLKSAAALLPPAAGSVQALRASEDRRSQVDILFKVFDNRPGRIDILVERPLYGTSRTSHVHVQSDGENVPSGMAGVRLPELPAAVKGEDKLLITLTDADGNSTRLEAEVSYQEPYNPYGR